MKIELIHKKETNKMKIIGNYVDDIPKLLTDLNINYEWVFRDEHGLSRTIKLNLFDIDYYLEFWANLFKVYIGKPYANSISCTTFEVYTHLCSSNKSLALDGNFYITLEPLDWPMKYLEDVK